MRRDEQSDERWSGQQRARKLEKRRQRMHKSGVGLRQTWQQEAEQSDALERRSDKAS